MADVNTEIVQEDKTKSLDTNLLLALTRTRLAADRTLMSWIRTAFSMISFGFAIIKFFELLRDLNPATKITQMSSSTKMGVFLILLGIFSLIPALIEHHKELTYIHNISGSPKWNYTFLIAVLVGIIGIYALVNGVFQYL